ncbi:MAG: cupredoxin domain-containing protein [Candidatus Solibacter usitatus]|nr:cupredoxin domain-containing protein [Candidatus Solibacter usitatus]
MFFAILLWITAFAVAAGFFVKRWWFPPPISRHAMAFDSLFAANLIAGGIIFLAVQLALGFVIFRYRDRGQRATFSTGSTRLEIILISLTAILFLGAVAASSGLWSAVHFTSMQSSDLKIETAGKQFAWSFRYPGPDGKFGKTDVRLINDAAGNPFGIPDDDAAGKDDIATSALRIPAGRPVQLLLHSHDVLHNFFVRELRVKQDLVPGMEIPLRIQADKTGEYEIACSELCGLGHHQMRSVLIVMPAAEFDAWLAQQGKRKQ